MFKKLKHKFHAKPTTIDNIRFDSKKESKRYQDLKLLQKSGEVLFFLRQTPFHLPGKIKIVIDFTVFWSSGEVTFEDVKGFMTPLARSKIAICEDLYGVKIDII